jgi:hypothetical protein
MSVVRLGMARLGQLGLGVVGLGGVAPICSLTRAIG